MPQHILDRIRAHLAETGLSRSGLARAAGLHANTLRDLDTPGWNPTAETLKKLESFLSGSGPSPLVPIEEIIAEARNGRMYILVDDEDRENEGDLIIPAQMATPDAINFMATHGRGLICLSLSKARVDQLGLPLMSAMNRTRHETAFTVSIEAKDGVTTGISAADRARTVAVAIDASKSAASIVTPGHVFPLVARDGGVLVRAGHTEAAVDVSRLAGLNPSGVICEIMNEDGSMARLDDLIPFARRHGLKIGTIRDLIAYRMRHDHLVAKVAEVEIDSEYGGRWTAITYANTAEYTEHLVLMKGRIEPGKPTLVRVHSLNPFADLLGETGGRAGLIGHAMQAIATEGAGILILIRDSRADGLSQQMKARGMGDFSHVRELGVGSQILVDLGVTDMVLLSTGHRAYVGLEGYGLKMVAERPLIG
ncbi:3,4-dihydroxy-2-butanone-4-phosphate synthase [Sandaracinobacter neustonicus]|uniref:3,4-dihydroxy-2-butanone 4-phosphate synthase n=1 Tax=Sandaracinobacter neustonicus TaxID=1715348 RepID=A0A501XF92_9SPHN|nr:3,4-dihydroxy-2-butanone-4-phosphate synthase [Sandaracinobacter neustonicus]TPE59232.1 3,4-dihydroxy-2-butanone-4-phosphate synthase [Sandaracinobacter neustonicus]